MHHNNFDLLVTPENFPQWHGTIYYQRVVPERTPAGPSTEMSDNPFSNRKHVYTFQ